MSASRLREILSTVVSDRDTRFVVVHLVLSRLVYVVPAVLTAMLIAAAPTPTMSIASLLDRGGEALGRLFLHGDGYWYQRLIAEGYPPGPFDPTVLNTWPFFPMFPILVVLLGGSTLAGVILSNAATLVAARLLLGQVAADHGRVAGRWAVLLLLYWPFSNMLSSFRPEALILLASVGAWVLARRERWWFAWLLVAVAAMCRPPGIVVGLIVSLEALGRHRNEPRRLIGAVAGAILPVAALAAFSIYQAVLIGDPLAWLKSQSAWGRSLDLMGVLAAYWTKPLFVRWTWDFALLNWIVLALLLVATAILVRRRSWSLASYLGVSAVLPLLSGNLIASGRYASTMFPAAMAAVIGRRARRARLGLLIVFAALLAAVGIMTVLALKPILP